MQGKIINGFELKKLLGVGGMAEVWYAESKIGMKAAVKILNEKLSHDDQMQERFLNEAKVMVQLDHPNIRKVHGYGSIDGRPAIIMEYLDGSDLKTRMKQGQRFTQEELKRWWNQMVDALNYTHAKEIVHRDIKPSNIFVDTDGNVKLLDFGIAKVCESSTKTRTGIMMGTLMYMSPEQVRNSKGVGPKSDAYSLAVTFVHLLTGQAPYESDSSDGYDIQENIVRKPLDISGVPSAWRSFLKPYLAKDPADRPALRAFEVIPEAPNDEDDGTIFEKGPNIPHSRPDDKPKGNNLLWILLGVVAVLILLIVLLWSKKPVDPDTKAFQDCQTVEDYRDYIDDYGPEALHYAEALDFIQRFMADSAQRVQDSLAQVQVERAETDAYRKCTTVRGCDNYLKTYPNGRYADQVSAKKAELEQKKAPTQRPTDDNPPQSVSQPQQQSQNHQQTTQNTPTVGNGGGSTSTTGIENGHEYVDLGLPSGTLWATCNVGASKPEDYGNYYAWGETSTKSTYEWNTYKYANGAYDKLTKYCSKPEAGNNGFTDNLTTLRASDDVATVNWGSSWHIPSYQQWVELKDNTTHKWTTRNGKQGYLFSSKKNGETLFLPAAGHLKDSELSNAGSNGYYWSRSLCTFYPDRAWRLYFNSDNYYTLLYYGRYYGFSVRPVREK